jgi:hypothetical protein
MATKTAPGAQVKRLLSAISERGAEHLTEIESDLAQTNVLLSEAIEKLGASFISMHAAIEAQRELIGLALSGATAPPDIAERLKSRQQEIALHVNAAITGLQFHDMTNQLIGRALCRVDGLRNAFGVIGSSVAGIPDESNPEKVDAVLAGINSVLDEQNSKLASALRKAVCQTHMESGDIELF